MSRDATLPWLLPTAGDSRHVLPVGSDPHRREANLEYVALVGDHDDVAEHIAEYHALGFDELILSGHPHGEEAYWFGKGVLLRVSRAGLVATPEPAPPAGVVPHLPSAAR